MDAIRLSDVSSWPAHFDFLFERVGAVFPRVDLRYQARGYAFGLLASVDRKNSWQLAEHLGHDKPFGLQRLLSCASWDAYALPSFAANRAPGAPPASMPMSIRLRSYRRVDRSRRGASSSICSPKMRCPHAGLSQKKRRLSHRIFTGVPRHGRSRTTRS